MDNNINTQWNLSLLYKDEQELNNHITEIFNKVDLFLTKYEILDISKFKADDFLQYLLELEELSVEMYKPHYYYSYKNTLDTQDQDNNKKSKKLDMDFNNSFNERYIKLGDRFKSLGYNKLIKLSNNKKLKNYKNYLINYANGIKYKLDISVENALNKMYEVNSYSDDLFNELKSSFTFIVDGESYTAEQVSAKWVSENEEERKKFLDVVYEKYKLKENKIIFGNLYSMVCMSNVANNKLRGITNVMESRNISEEMENDVVDSMIDNVKSKYYILHDYLKLKAKLLNKEKLEAHDIFAPVKLTDKKDFINFEDGLNFYYDIIKKFDKEFYEYSKSMVDDGRLDVFPKEGKRGGAYSSSSKTVGSYILLNYTDTFSDVSTLAHEFGHSIHAYYYDNANTAVNANVSLCLAETASIFNETLISEYLIENRLKTDEEKVEFIMDYLDGMFGTLYRQIL